MGMTMAEKILASHCGRDRVTPGEIIMAKLDVIMAHDATAPMAIREFRRIGVPRVFDPSRIVLVSDHNVPNQDGLSAENNKLMRDFARQQGITYFELGRSGNCHTLLPEGGLVLPGDVAIGADSHSCTYGGVGAFATGMGMIEVGAAMATGETWLKVPQTILFVYHGKLGKWVTGKDLILHTIKDIGVDGALYAAMEFTGEAIAELPVDARLTMSNMSVEAGAKAGIFRVDTRTLDYVRPRAKRNFTVFQPDKDAKYARTVEYDVSNLEPQVAVPELPSNAKPVSQVGNVEIDQAIIGSCTNGRLEDMRQAAKVLAHGKVHPRVRLIITPATQGIYLEALREGFIQTFVEAGATIFSPGCGVCSTGHPGIIAPGERCVSTTNRNFPGRMGTGGEVYLANAAVVAASAVLGRIASPEEVAK